MKLSEKKVTTTTTTANFNTNNEYIKTHDYRVISQYGSSSNVHKVNGSIAKEFKDLTQTFGKG